MESGYRKTLENVAVINTGQLKQKKQKYGRSRGGRLSSASNGERMFLRCGQGERGFIFPRLIKFCRILCL